MITVTANAKSRGGRPWTFDRDQALELAMRMFWRHGYEGVSIADLTKALGIAAPSLYAAFGSKAALYREALSLYERQFGTMSVPPPGASLTMAEMVRILLHGAAVSVTDPARERGCMVSNGMITCHPDHSALALDLTRRREGIQEKIAAALAEYGDTRAVRALARHLAAVMLGISVLARDGAAPEELDEIVEEFVAGVEARAFGSQRVA